MRRSAHIAKGRSVCWALCVLLGALVSSVEAQSFTDVTATWGVGDSGAGDGIAWGDYDSDGDLDLYIAYSGGGSNILYRNDGSRFYNTGQANAAGSHHGATWGDYDGDGDLDLYAPESGGNNLLYRNDGSDTFVDVASGAGVQSGGDYSPGWVDYDRDGDLDLYVANSTGANVLFNNNGSGSFTDVAATAAVADANNTPGAVWGDYNNDGWLDLYIANSDAANVLYENVGDGTFTDVTSTATVGAGSGTYEASWGDYDNDGDLDLHVSYYSSTADLLYKNNSDGTFTESASGAGVGNTNNSMASTWGDFDLDGDLDLYVGNDNGANLLYSNNGNGTFTDVAAAQGVDEGGTNRTVSWADFDGDGDLDIFLTNSGNSSLGVNKLFQNGSASGKSWLKVKLTGDAKNKTAIGALAVAWTGGSSQRLQVEGASGRNSQNAPERIFGFGSATTIDSVVVRWPSGQVSASFTPAVSTTLSLTEPPLTVFSSVATAAGVNDSGNHWRGGVWADYDADGDEDFYLFTDNSAANKLYKNNGNSTFTNLGGTTANSGDNGGAAWGDYDGDGDLDLYVTTNGAANQLYRYDGSDTFVNDATNSGTGSTGASTAAAWMDYDNDGDLDLFVAATAEANLLYKNDGLGVFTDVATTALVTDASGQARGIAWGDYDDDGDQDLYIANQSAANKLYGNNGDGTFSDVGGTTADASSSLSPVWVDFDNDKDLDLFVYNGATDNRLYRNDGGGTFVDVAVAARIAPTATGGQGTWADYDNDGDLDLYVATSAPNNLFLNNGNGAFDEVGHAAGVAGVGSALGASWGDYDGNGFLDLFVANLSGTQNLLFDNQINTNKWLHVELEGLGSDSYGYGATVWAKEAANVQRRDLGGGSGYLSAKSPAAYFGFGNLGSSIDEIKVVWSSGFSNVLTSVTSDQTILVTERAVVSQTPAAGTRNAARTSNVAATFSAAVTAVSLNTFIVHGSQTGELSGAYSGSGTDSPSFNPTNDLLPGEEIEVRFANGTSAGLLSYRGTPVNPYIYRFTAAAGTGPAEFTSVFSSPFSSSTHAVDLGDVDGDGDLDLVAGNAVKQNAVYLNTGTGAMTGGPNNFGTGSDNTMSVDLGDLDGDGYLDIVAANINEQNTSHINNGSGGFAASANFGTGTDATRPLVLGDLDGDGFLDVAVGNDGAQNVVYFNDGAGVLNNGSENFGTGTDATKGLEIGDVDKDGDLDLWLGNFGEANKIALNNGWGVFTVGNTFGTGSDQSHWLAVGDIDGDGDVDVVSANIGAQARPETNDGTGTFSAGTSFGASATGRGLKLGDVDGDGDLDAALSYDSDAQSAVYLNNASGVFSAGTKTYTGASIVTMQVALGDIDGDNDLDVVAGNNGRYSEVHFNSVAPTVSSTSPTAAFSHAPSTGNVTATFSAAVTAGDAASFVVHSSMRGKKAGAYSGNNSTTLTFNPTNNFFPGETVFSTLTTTVQDASGAKLSKGHVWGFTVEAAVGPAVFSSSSHDVDTPTNTTTSTSLGDIDGDGDLDLIAGNESQVNRVYLGNGNGTFASGSDVDTPTNVTKSTALGDVDGDGDLDLIAGNDGQVNRVYLGNGNGTFATGSDVDAPTNNTRSVSLGDLDGDGDLDLVTGNQSQVNRVYLSNGNGTFASGNDVDTPANATMSTSLGDLDGDGDLDLVTGNQDQVNRLYLSNGDGTFAAGSDVDTPTNTTFSVSLGDVDADGDLDLIVGNATQANRVYLGNGNGSFAAGNNVDTPTNSTYSTSLGDYDGDGDLDLVTGNLNQVNRLYLSNGNGTFATGSDAATPTNATLSISLGDVDGDGDLDFVEGNQNQVNRVYLNSSAIAPTVSSTSPTAAFSHAPSTGNVTATFSIAVTGGDVASFVVHSSMRGKKAGAYSGNNSTTLTFNPTNNFFPGETVFSTLVSTIRDGSNNSLSKGHVWGFTAQAAVGPGEFTSVFSNVASSNTSTRSILFGDVDGDGDLDLAHFNDVNASAQNIVYLNDGSGSYTAGTKSFGPGTDNTKGGALADIDGDGDLDAAASNNGQNAAYLNDGTGNFTAGTKNFGTGSDDTQADVAFGDVDGDGDLDVAVGNKAQQNVVYLNDGAGNFNAGSSNFGTGSDETLEVALGDVDNDGDLDLAAGNNGAIGEQNAVYLNDGAGNFTAGTKNFGTATDKTNAMALGDVDGDGDLDIATGNISGGSGQQNVAYLNDGSGNFNTGTKNFGSGSDDTLELSFGDVDGDGDLDIALANNAQQNAVVLNDGSGNFTAGTKNFGTGSDATSGIALGDADGDGDLDIAAGNLSQQNIIYFNAIAPNVSSTSPTAAFASAPSTGNVTATFSIAVTGGDAASFVVHSSMRGKKAGAYSGNNSTTLTFNPSADFFPGETVFSTLVSTIRDGSNNSLSKGHVWGFTAQAAVGPATFSSGSSADAASTYETTSASLGDLDGDGDLDLVTGNDNQVNRVYLGAGNGTFAAGNDVDATVLHTIAVALGDVDGDGDLDLIAGNGNSTGSGEVNRVYLGNGNGTFAAGSDVAATANKTAGLGLGDLDADGDLDLVVANQTAVVNRVYLGNGNGTFDAGNDLSAATNNTRAVALGDLDGDGDIDLVTTNNNSEEQVYLSNGDGTFASGVNVSGDTNQGRAVVLGDLDADGDLDLVVANNTQTNRIHLGNGNGTFAAGSDVDASTDGIRGLALGDLDGDGDLDLVLAKNNLANPFYLSNGNGTFAAASNVAADANLTRVVMLGDLDGDGDLDIVEGNSSATANRVYINGTGSAAPTVSSTSPVAAFSHAPSTGNVTATFSAAVTGGDAATFRVFGSMSGKRAGAYSGNNSTTLTFNPTNDFFPGEAVFSTLVSTIRDGSNNSLSKGHVWSFTAQAAVGPGNFSAVFSNFASANIQGKSLALGDVDGDGDLDLALGIINGQSQVLDNDGSGSFTAASQNISGASTNTYATAFGDMDGDGDLDLVIGQSNGAGNDEVHFNDGSGGFSLNGTYGPGSNDTWGVALADLNADGYLDIAAANHEQQNMVLINNGSGGFSSSGLNYGNADEATFVVDVGDIDNDGDIDVVMGNSELSSSASLQNKAFFNDGTGNLGTSSNFGTGSDNSRAVILGDVDGDGDLDVAVANNTSEQSAVYLNNGSGTFNAGTRNFGGASGNRRHLALGDMDGDGDLDIASPKVSGQNVVFVNDGSGNFSGSINYGSGSDNSQSVALGDVDGDGDLDLLDGNQSTKSYVYFNAASPFIEVASAASVADAGNSRGTAWGDYDGDGDLDLYLANDGTANKLFRNEGSGTFLDRASAVGMADASAGNSVAWADYDGDGDLDLYLTNYGTANRLYRNDGSTFAEVASGAAVDDGTVNSRGASWADYDLDGDLDLYVANEVTANRLYRNEGGGTFLDRASVLSIADVGASISAVWGDYDRDGDPDLYVANSDVGASRLYRNEGNASFTEIGSASGTDDTGGTAIGAAWGDMDNDGDLDLYLSKNANNNKLFRNDGADTFAEVATASGVNDAGNGIGVAWADYDNDGDQDLYLAKNGAANQLYRNDGSNSFASVGSSLGVDDSGAGHAVSWADYDSDGDVDLYLSNLGSANRLYRNDSSGNHWLRVKLTGAGNNTTAIGARAKITISGNSQWRDVEGGTGWLSQASPVLAFGLGSATNVDNLTVTWANGSTTVQTSVSTDQTLTITEPSPVSATFSSIATSAGVNDAGTGRGVAWDDYDADGDLDLYVGNSNTANRLYRNDGSNTFTEVGSAAGVDDAGDIAGVGFADYDNDGDRDLYIAKYSTQANKLYRNDGSSTFTEVGSAAGVADAGSSTGLGWADYDADGDLDFYVANWGQADRLYRNDGSGTFTEVGSAAGMADAGLARSPVWADYDADGDLDMFLTRSSVADFLYRNDGSGTFTEVGSAAGVADAGDGMAASWGDYDNDGDFDLYVSRYSAQANLLYRNDGSGTFAEVGSAAGVADAGNGLATVFFDYDNDADLDLYASVESSADRFYVNDGSGSFNEYASLVNTNSTQSGYAAAAADYDNDGDLDLYVSMDNTSNRLYQNQGNSNKWLKVKLTGDGSTTNKSAIGVLVAAKTGSLVQQSRVDGGSGLYSQGSLPVEFGFGSTTNVDKLTVTWSDGSTTVQNNVATNQTVNITKGGGGGGGLSGGSGPGGVGKADGSTALAIWLKADANTSTTTDAAPVSSWGDASSSNNGFAQGTGSAQPLYKTSVLNGQPVLRFDGSDDVMTTSGTLAIFASNTSPLTAILVFNTSNNEGKKYLLNHATGSNGSANFELGYDVATGTGSGNFGLHQGTSNAVIVPANTIANSTFNIMSLGVGSGSSPGNIAIYQNGSTLSPSNDGTGWLNSGSYPTGTDNMSLGARIYADNGTTDGYHIGDIAEVILVKDKLEDVQRILVENYLSAKYAIALGANDVYVGDDNGNGDYDLEVFGMGKMGGIVHMQGTAGGLKLFDTGFLSDNGDWMLAGHASTATVAWVNTDLGSVSANERWNRLWYIDRTDAGSNGGNVRISFNYSDVGLGSPAGATSNYALLNRAGQSGDFLEISGTSVSFNGNIVEIQLDATNIGDGYYTLGYNNSSSSSVVVFSDAATAAGVQGSDVTRGVAWGDYDKDGDDDLYATNNGVNRLYRNDGSGVFSEVGSTAGVADAGDGLSSVWGDYDGDSDLDLYVANNGANALYRNDGSGVFAEVASSAGVTDANTANAASWVDYDLDGDLDLYATNSNAANALYRNDGGGVFSSQSSSAAADAGNGVGAAWGDYDSDGDPDLYLVNDGTANRLLRNDGSGTFVDQGGTTADTGNGQGAAWGDFDSDGDLDLYVTNSGGSNRLYRNDSASFTDIAGTAGLASSGGNGFAWGDYDADGDLDLYITLVGSANKFYQNNGGGSFAEIGSTASVNDAGNSRGVAWSDYDADGDLDFYVGNGSPNLLYKNNGNSNNALRVGLTRTRGDAAGIGSLVEIWTGGQGRQQIVDGGSGLYSQNSSRLFFGLGTATQADSVVINWPQGQRQVLGVQTANSTLSLVEPLGESLSARGQNGTHLVAPSASKQIFHIGVVGDGSTTVDSLALTLSDLSTATGITASDISALCVYSSSDTLFDQGDTQLAIQNTVNIGSETKLGFTPDTVPSATERFYIAVAKIAANPTDGHAFRTSFASGGLHTSSGYIGTAVAANDANNVTIDVVATKLAFATQPSGSVSGSALTTQPVVEAQDANGNLDTGFSSTVTLTTTAGGTLSNATATPSAGVATFSGLSYAATADSQSVALTAASSGLSSATATAFVADVIATKLVFSTQPAGAVHATALTTQPVVQAQNASGILDTGMSGTVTLAASAGTLSGGTATMSAGVATFSALAMSGVSSATTLTASFSSSGVSSVTSNSLAVTIAPLSFAFSNVSVAYDGQAKAIGLSSNPSGIGYSVTYNGSATLPINPGTYSVVVTTTDANYTGTASAEFTILGPAAPTTTLSASPTTGPIPLTVQFTSVTTGEYTSSTLTTGKGDALGGFSSGSVIYTQPGTYTAELTVSGPGGSSKASTTIVALGPPKIGAIGAATAKEDSALTLNLSGKDGDAGTWSVSGLDNALIASAAVSGESITFTPVKDKFGSDVVTVTRTSSLGLKTSQDVALTWTPVDDPPVFANLPATASAKEDSAIQAGGAAFVQDIDSDVGKFEWTAAGHQASIVASATGGTNGVHFVPVRNAFGQSKTTLKVKDPVAGVEIAQEITLTWMPVNDPPEKPRIAKPVNNARDVPLATVLSWSAEDVDKDPLKYDVFFARVGQPPKQVASGLEGTGYSALGLEPGGEYEWRVVARDPSGATADTVSRFTTEADKLPPRISMLSATPVADGVRVVWETDEPAAFVLNYRSAPEVATDTVNSGELIDTLRTKKFEVSLLALQPATWHDFSVRVRDRFQNESPPAAGRFRTLAAPDTVKPNITPGSIAVNGITEKGVWIRWATDELSTGIVTYAEQGVAAKLAQATDGASSGVVREQTLSREHAIELIGLKSKTRYRFVAESVDASGNVSKAVEDVFETAAEADIVAPKFTLGPGVRAPKVESVDIELEADEVVEAEVRYDIDDTPEDGRVASGGNPATGHQVTLDGLLAGTTYSFQVQIVDVGGNSTLSDVFSVVSSLKCTFSF